MSSSPPPFPSAADSSSLPHNAAVELVRDNLRELLARDPVLRAVLVDGTPAELLAAEELDSLVALERGRALSVFVERGNATRFRVVVPEHAAVADLKRAVRRAVTLEQTKLLGKTPSISWKHVWRTNWLCFESTRLKDDSAKLKDLGIVNKSRVAFAKKRKGD